MTKKEKEFYKKGFEDGLRCFAYWQDGNQLVGTAGTPLKKALETVEDRWNFFELAKEAV